MRSGIFFAALLMGVMGLATAAAEENRGLSPIIPIIPQVAVQAESAQQMPELITLAQAAGSEKVLYGCRDVENDPVVKDLAMNYLNPSYVVFRHLGYQVKNGDYNAPQSVKDSVKTSLFKLPIHGTIVPLGSGEFNGWGYQGNAGYEGTDQATFLVEVSGKRYKVVINYLVHEVVDQNANPPACESVFPPSTTPSRGMTIDPTADAAASSSLGRIEALSKINTKVTKVKRLRVRSCLLPRSTLLPRNRQNGATEPNLPALNALPATLPSGFSHQRKGYQSQILFPATGGMDWKIATQKLRGQV